jgi:Spy/CpxP family protein refolding chaperone
MRRPMRRAMRRLMRRLLVAVLVPCAVPLALLGAQERAPARRDTLERSVREALTRRVQEALGASDDQMRRLEPINRRFEAERRTLLLEERGTRRELRVALQATSPDQAHVGRLLDRLFALQRRRLELLEREQRELAAVLTPSQRARYLVMQDEVRRRVEDMRDRRGRRGRGARP